MSRPLCPETEARSKQQIVAALKAAVQSGFPDCEAKIEVEPERWQHFRIEFEYESRGFRVHGHDSLQCDLIVCWRHNWKNCPPHIQVLELSKLVARFAVR